MGFLVAFHAQAANTEFINTSGDGLWNTATNWSLGSVPGATNHAVVNSGRIATIAADAPFVDRVSVGDDAVSNTILLILANLTANQFRVSSASNAIGAVHQSNGVVSIASVFEIASTSAGSDVGSYTISDGSLLLLGLLNLKVGTQGRGFFTVDSSGRQRYAAGT